LNLEMPTLARPTFLHTTLSYILERIYAVSVARISLSALCFAFLVLPASATNQTVGALDSRVYYEGTWVPQDGQRKFTVDTGASLSFTFTGA
jgi:hypothetical protein